MGNFIPLIKCHQLNKCIQTLLQDVALGAWDAKIDKTGLYPQGGHSLMWEGKMHNVTYNVMWQVLYKKYNMRNPIETQKKVINLAWRSERDASTGGPRPESDWTLSHIIFSFR